MPFKRTQIGHAVDAAGVALLAHDQDGQDRAATACVMMAK